MEQSVRPNTHLCISSEFVGQPLSLSEGKSVVQLSTSAAMAADDRGLVHGGFTFGLADYAAMLAVNDPNVVLGGADAKFLAPVKVGEVLLATAELIVSNGKKRQVKCTVKTEIPVFEGIFTCFVLDKHILES